MTSWGDMDYVPPVALDIDTADRLLAGAVAPNDAPPSYADLARLLDAASAEPSADELGRETEVVAMMAAEVCMSSGNDTPSPGTHPASSYFSRARIAAALVAVGLVCGTGLAWAGALPGPAQDIASSVLDKVSISVPADKDGLGARPNGRRAGTDMPLSPVKSGESSRLAKTIAGTGGAHGPAASAAARDKKSRAGQHSSGSSASGTAAAGKGNKISELAKTNKGTGGSHGATVSAAASKGKSRAGQHGSAPSGGSGKGKADPPGRGKEKDDPPGGRNGKSDPPGGGKGKAKSSPGTEAQG
ncbi:MAG: hypothetical protein ACRDMY_10705 [Gaiellaceae bacterium]